uniref:Uncharacterized protein n=2 Tax=Nicotiana TaxID=4085 RepID=A0A1S3XS17_TOBAC|nr:PREDICTED: uncharacterized protein LOC104222068 [Nicotiana sylvestris]XP_016442746.1 PREDICTED: uncharacterized protein LOC107768157 [Nicotiana tabacum]
MGGRPKIMNILVDLADAARLLQEALTQVGVSGSTSSASVLLRSPRPENKQPKRKRSSVAVKKNKRAKTIAPVSSPEVLITSPPPGPVIGTMMIDDDGEASDDGASLHRRQRSSSTQHNAQSVGLITPTEDDTSELWGEFDLVKNSNSRVGAPIYMPGMMGISIESLPSLVGEHTTTSAAFDAVAFYSSTPSSSFPSSPIPTIATSFPSSSTLAPTIVTSSPPAASDHKGDVPPPSPQFIGIWGKIMLLFLKIPIRGGMLPFQSLPSTTCFLSR